ncbi:MAG TPA: PAS domain-containing protein, partial [Streptosporangiaceae bacterium]|nr:PAS domain-containing protein [Streptosporangiaceae bacterium]
MQAPVGVVMLDAELRVVWVNAAAERLSAGRPAGGWPGGRRLGEVLPGVGADVIERSLRRVLATGEPAFDLEVTARADGEPGGERAWSCLQFRVEGPDGAPAGVAHMMLEVTERIQSQRRLALADEASARIGTTLDITRTAEEL